MTTNPTGEKIGGLALLATGLMLAALMHAHPGQIKVPTSVAYGSCALFGVGGISVLARSYGQRAVGQIFVCLVLLLMLGIAAWIAVGSGSGYCVASLPLAPSACRAAFGTGAIILAGFLVLAAIELRRR